ncbi:TSCPD domain-containing protein [Halopseudomonas pertucinogena]|uniref:ribonucleoside-diphosphate reductase n=1 Tax=Halopseudomonas pertucinogena TaxID=86175 RepID=A0ABQ2CPG9_9GAMM|nr:NrdJb [Halopseudomonas pertucinogena]GGI95405.1 TSCPD domain-containing protein [Halopseudomonas pertucinogena]
MSIKISKKIVDYSVVKPDEQAVVAEVPAKPDYVVMHEKLKRPEHLEGCTYKIKTPTSEHAIYVTINDVVLNRGSEHEVRRPFEIFINSKNMEHYQWISALTLIISAVFRKGGDCTFLVEELRSVFDPKGGYMKRGGRWMPSLVAEIGDVLEQHLKHIGLIKDEVDEHQRAYLEQKRAEFTGRAAQSQTDAECDDSTEDYPAGAQLCGKCHTKAAVQMDGCLTCLACGDSKCG